MKFYTTEWYNNNVTSQMYTQFRKTQNAAHFSEKFFEKLYKLEKKSFVRYYKRAARLERRAFDAAATEKQFDLSYEENLAFVKANLPAEILEKVADVRVLALGSVEYEVAAEIERFCGKLNRLCNNAENEYDEQLDKTAQIVGWDTVHALDNLIDTAVESVEKTGADVLISLWSEETGATVTVILRDAELPENSECAHGAVVCRHELLVDGERLSFGLLCSDAQAKPVTLESATSRVEIKIN